MAKAYKFDSGLLLLYEKNNINKSTSIEIGFDCGARCDGDLPGLSHFCEHMFFTGTEKLSKKQVTKRYYDMINVNAYTTSDDITFTGNIMTSDFEKYLSSVYDMICNSTFTKEAIEEEKKIVIQEIVRDQDKYSRHAQQWRRYELYKKEHFKHSVLGTEESVSKITRADIKKYIKKYFVNNNCCIVICSSLSFNKVKNIIKKQFEQKLATNNLKPTRENTDEIVSGDNVVVYTKDINKNYLSITFKFKRSGPDIHYRTLMTAICNLMDDFSEGLGKDLRLDNSLVYSVGADWMINKVNSSLAIFTEVSTENIKPCVDVIINYINNLVEHGFSEEQLKQEQVKDLYYWQTKVAKPDGIRDNLYKYHFYKRFITGKEIHDRIQKVKLDEINQTMKELFAGAEIQMFVYGNATKKDVYTINQIKKKIKFN